MTKFKRQRTERAPSHPGEILKNIWLDEIGITQTQFGNDACGKKSRPS